MHTAASYLRRKYWHFEEAFLVRLLSKNLCPYLRCTVHILELHAVEGQSTLPIHLQQERFCFINNRYRRLFAWRHLEAGQYVAQSRLHLHQCETHSWKENKKNSSHYLRNSGGFTMSLILPNIVFNKILYVHIADTVISADARKQIYLPSRISSCKENVWGCYRPEFVSKSCRKSKTFMNFRG